MKFHTQYNNKITPTNAGKEEITEYQRIQNEHTKEWKLKPIGKRNIYNEIQEAGIGTSLKEMIIKYQNDEIDTFGNEQNNYIDTTNIPEHFTEREELKITNFEKIQKLEELLKKANEKLKEQTENEKK